MLVNGLGMIGALRQSGYPAENLLAQVWVSLYRFGEITKIMYLGSYKGSQQRPLCGLDLRYGVHSGRCCHRYALVKLG